ncbi:hypothetical protein B6U93_04580 [Candidatus Woesearchaeota archaeon ex4484_78]|nr:MAG: hypothetical protein B6U93_04580 [Candidatus Woesearchaeota archaeon ex4484_78]
MIEVMFLVLNLLSSVQVNSVLSNVIILFISALTLVFGADLTIRSISGLAKKLGASEYLVGFVVVALGTSTPELITAVVGSLTARAKLMTGFGTLVLAVILGLDGVISRVDGVVLILLFFWFINDLWKKESSINKLEKHVRFRSIVGDVVLFLIAIPIIIFSAKFLVNSAVIVAYQLKIPSFLIGLTLVSIGTTLPELTLETRSVLRGHKDIGFGDLLGSVVANITLILGIASLINPINFMVSSFAISAMFMITSVFIAILFIDKKSITWREGLGLILLYITFLISEGVTTLIS